MNQIVQKQNSESRNLLQPKFDISHLPAKDVLYSRLKKYLMGKSSGYLNPGARRSMSKIMGCPMLKWDMIHPDTKLNHVLQSITALNEVWIRPLEDFDPEQVDYASWIDEELFRHLFLRYEIPEFLDNQIRNILTDGYKSPLEKNCLAWMVILGQGGSLRKAARVIGWDMPKLFQQKLYVVPATGLTLEHGVTWALILAVGGSPLEARRQIELSSRNSLRILLEPGRDHFKQFWSNTISWMFRNRFELDFDRWANIRRWLTHINTEVLEGRTQFSWKGRTVKSVHLLAQNYLVRRKHHGYVGPWRRKGWDWIEKIDGVGECAIIELTSSAELVEEGELMDHCVGMYAADCSGGSSSIFSLRIDGVRTLTIMLTTADQKLEQVYGYRNREPSDQELAVVKQWQSLITRNGCLR